MFTLHRQNLGLPNMQLKRTLRTVSSDKERTGIRNVSFFFLVFLLLLSSSSFSSSSFSSSFFLLFLLLFLLLLLLLLLQRPKLWLPSKGVPSPLSPEYGAAVKDPLSAVASGGDPNVNNSQAMAVTQLFMQQYAAAAAAAG